METYLQKHKNRITLALLLVVIISMVAMRVFDAPLKNEDSLSGIVSFELAKTKDASVRILDSWGPQEKINAGLSLGLDFLFLILYSSFIALLIFNINNRLWKDQPLYKVGRLLIAAVFLAALFDAIENLALIQLLLGDIRQIWSSLAYYFAAAKFIILILCILYLLLNWLLLLFKQISVQKT